jgi:hypothetical protein
MVFRQRSQPRRVREEFRKYAPQFGGYCAWAVGHSYTAVLRYICGDPYCDKHVAAIIISPAYVRSLMVT